MYKNFHLKYFKIKILFLSFKKSEVPTKAGWYIEAKTTDSSLRKSVHEIG